MRSIDTGLLPLAGASRFYDWRGMADFENLPSAYGPALGVQVVSPHPDASSFQAPITWLWSNQGGAERVQRAARGRPARSTSRGWSRSSATPFRVAAPRRCGMLLEGAEPASSSAQRVQAMLLEWDGSTATDSVGASLYHVFRQRLSRKLLEGSAPVEGLARAARRRPSPRRASRSRARSTASDPRRSRRLRDAALDETWSFMRSSVSANPKKWNWGEVHELRLRHAFERLGDGPLAWVGRRLGSGPFAAPGDPDSVWTMYNGDLPDDALELGPALRYAVDLGDPEHALFGLAGGQSGHPGSPHYADALADWLSGQPRPLWMHASDVSYHQKGTWELHPADP